jgi:hypothetical protein
MLQLSQLMGVSYPSLTLMGKVLPEREEYVYLRKDIWMLSTKNDRYSCQNLFRQFT